MRKFFQALEQHRVRYLLVGGQAAVLYGAALFSEDIDVWVDPGAENMEALRACLRGKGALYHKLTPPLTSEFAARGHGYHFRIPDDSAGGFYLDVMGKPPL